MTDQSNPQGASFKVDRALLALAVIALCIALYDMNEFLYTIDFTIKTISGTAPFIAFAVLAVAYLKATGAETLLAKAFEGAPQNDHFGRFARGYPRFALAKSSLLSQPFSH